MSSGPTDLLLALTVHRQQFSVLLVSHTEQGLTRAASKSFRFSNACVFPTTASDAQILHLISVRVRVDRGRLASPVVFREAHSLTFHVVGLRCGREEAIWIQ